MSVLPLLLILIPLVGALVAAVLPDRLSKFWALGTSLTAFAAAVALTPAFAFDGASTGIAFGPGGVRVAWPADPAAYSVTQLGFSFSLGLNAIGYWLALLTTFLVPLAIAASFGSIKERQREYYGWMLALLAFMLGVFVARDALLFYVFFELTLIPMFFIIGIWGGPDRRWAATKFFLFTFAGSVFLLGGVVYLGLTNPDRAGAFGLDSIVRHAQTLPPGTRTLLLMALLAGFAVKVPLFPVHTWLPLAHTEAPTAGSVILAGVLLKLGTYGLLVLALPIGLVGIEDASRTAIQFIAVLSIIGIIYGALVAWVQKDIKKLVAYSSVSHLGFCVLGLAALNTIGLQGSVFYMVSHGISTGAMFLVIGMIYDRYHTRDIDALGGLAKRMPVLAFFFVLFAMSSIGLPGTNGFVSEFLTILGAFTSRHLGFWYGATAATGVVLGAIYMLHMTARVMFGPLKVPDLHGADPHALTTAPQAHGFSRGPTPPTNYVAAGSAPEHDTAPHDPETIPSGANADIAADAPDRPTQPEDVAGETVRGPNVEAVTTPRGVSPAQTDRGQGVAPGRAHADPHDHGDDETPGDLTGREIAILVPLAVVVIALGVFPNPLLRSIREPLDLARTGGASAHVAQTPAAPAIPSPAAPAIPSPAAPAIPSPDRVTLAD